MEDASIVNKFLLISLEKLFLWSCKIDFPLKFVFLMLNIAIVMRKSLRLQVEKIQMSIIFTIFTFFFYLWLQLLA